MLLGFTRQAYYQHFWYDHRLKIENQLVLNKIRQIRQSNPRMGTRKLQVLLKAFLMEHQFKMGRDALFDLLASQNMLIRRKRRRMRTTFSGHWYKRFPYLIADLEIVRINQLWVSDITYVKTHQGFLYLYLITDACSHKIVGYDITNNLEAVNAVKALRMAIDNALKENVSLVNLIHHSDQGIQYCAPGFVNLLKQHFISISMCDRGQPLQNAIAERINGILKEEYLFQYENENKEFIRQKLPETINIYNTLRPHMSCAMLTPEQAYLHGESLKRCWKNYYRKTKPECVNVL
jgi:putative transposase